MRRRLTAAIMGFVVVALAAAGVVVFLLSPETHFVHVLELRGRIVDAATGSPLEGAWVLTLPPNARVGWQAGIAEHQRERADDRYLRDETGARIGLGGAPAWAEVRSGDDGRFAVGVGVPWTTRWVAWVFPTRTTPPARSGVGALHIEAGHGGTAVVDIAGGEWVVAPRDARPTRWATWDLGDISVSLER